MATVKKRDGSEEEFSESKLRTSIQRACQDCDIPEERGKELVEEISSRVVQDMGSEDRVRSKDIRSRVLGELDAMEPAVSAAWREYDREEKERR